MTKTEALEIVTEAAYWRAQTWRDAATDDHRGSLDEFDEASTAECEHVAARILHAVEILQDTEQ